MKKFVLFIIKLVQLFSLYHPPLFDSLKIFPIKKCEILSHSFWTFIKHVSVVYTCFIKAGNGGLATIQVIRWQLISVTISRCARQVRATWVASIINNVVTICCDKSSIFITFFGRLEHCLNFSY